MRLSLRLFGSPLFDFQIGTEQPAPFHGQLAVEKDDGDFEYIDMSNMISEIQGSGPDGECDCGECDEPDEDTKVKAKPKRPGPRLGF